MKRLDVYHLKAPHHPREAFVIAECRGETPRMLGVTVWMTDPDPRTDRVGVSYTEQLSPQPPDSPVLRSIIETTKRMFPAQVARAVTEVTRPRDNPLYAMLVDSREKQSYPDALCALNCARCKRIPCTC